MSLPSHFVDPDAPCWCGSGAKYGHCHLGRETQERPRADLIEKAQQRLRSRGSCLYPTDVGATCKSNAIKGHTISRNALDTIAERGHICGLGSSLYHLTRTDGSIEPFEIGVGKASTVRCFCRTHDNATFAPVDDRPLVPTAEQAFLLAYRALCGELWVRQVSLCGLEMLRREGDKGLPELAQVEFQCRIARGMAGIEASVRDMRSWKTQYDHMLLNKEWCGLSSLIIKLDSRPEVLCCGFGAPTLDFAGKRIQRKHGLRERDEYLACSILPAESGGFAMLSGIGAPDGPARRFVRTLTQIGNTELPHAVLWFALVHFENVFFAPSWWHTISEEAKQAVTQQLQLNTSMSNEEAPGALRGHPVGLVEWEVVERSSSW